MAVALNNLRRLQRESGDEFEQYRRGLRHANNPVRQQAIANRQLPEPLVVDAYDPLYANVFSRFRRSRLMRGGFNIQSVAGPGVLAAQVARQNANDLVQAIGDFQTLNTQHGNTLRFVKTLGVGGMGIASLWEWTNTATGQVARSVVKTAIPNTGGLAPIHHENDKLHILARAKHIIQRFLVQPFVGGAAAATLDADNDQIVLEWVRRGDLNALLSKVGRRIYRPRERRHRTNARNRYVVQDEGERFPKAIIWQIFDCLVTGCMDMAYPPRQQAPPNEADTFPEVGAWLMEEIPDPGPNKHEERIIHFDLDPSNVYVADTDATHRRMPLIKIADFGLAHTVDETRTGNRNQAPPYNTVQKTRIWSMRRAGKDGFHLPEQFTSDWDKVGSGQDPFSQNWNNNPISAIGDLNTVAANYGEWSNVWQIGLIVWCCMTNWYPLHPPIARQDPANNNNWTYGVNIMQPKYTGLYGQDLCKLVSWCLMHKPIDRPSLRQLRDFLDDVVQPPVLTADDRAWLTRYLRLPPLPSGYWPINRAFW